jgi:hypothetical protein
VPSSYGRNRLAAPYAAFDWQRAKLFESNPYPSSSSHDHATGENEAHLIFSLLRGSSDPAYEYRFIERTIESACLRKC